MKDFFKRKGWRICFAAYIFIYLPWFSTLEKVINSDYPGLHIINIPFDNMIPFCEYFIIPYVLWFLYVVAACIYMYFKADNKEFIQFALSLIIGMSLSLTICMIYPNGLTLRPDYIPDNFCGKIINALYTIDTSTNVFPSIHVYNSLAVNFALLRCKVFKRTYNNKDIIFHSLHPYMPCNRIFKTAFCSRCNRSNNSLYRSLHFHICY